MEIDIVEIISRGENQTLEFLSDKASPIAIAREISAFANTNGGTILLGVDDSSAIQGVEPDAARLKINKALEMLSSADVVEFDLQQTRIVLYVAVITVRKANEIVFCDSGAYIRNGKSTRAMHPDEMRPMLSSSDSSIEALSVVLEKQTVMIESLEKTLSDLRNEVAQGNSMQAKLKDHSIGALIGGVFGIAFGSIGF